MDQYLKRKRVRLNLTQTEAAKQLGVTESTVQNWENGRSRPDFSNFKAISRVYNTPIAELVIEVVKLVEAEIKERENPLDAAKDLFPEDIKWDILDLSLSEVEQNVLLTIKIANRFGQNPIPSLCDLMLTMVELDNILDKFIDFGILKVKEIRGDGSLVPVCSSLVITKLGYFIIDTIKRNAPVERFDIKNHLSTMEAFKILEPSAGKSFIKVLIDLFKHAAVVPLDTLHDAIYQINKYLYNNKEQINKVVDFFEENDYIMIKEKEIHPTKLKCDDGLINRCKAVRSEYLVLPTDKTLQIVELLEY